MLPLSVPLHVQERAARVGTTVDSAAPESEPTLYWVVTGRLVLTVGGTRYRVDAGRAIWIPHGQDITVDLGATDTVVPVRGINLGAHAHTRIIAVPDDWEPWILTAYGASLGFLDGVDPRRILSNQLATVAGSDALMPVLPRSRAALAVAQSVVADPGRDVTVEDAAHRAGMSAKTLHRHFRSETGLGLRAWVRSVRLAIATEALAEGRDIEWVAHHCGYSSRSALTRACREYTGRTPAQWRAREPADPVQASALTDPAPVVPELVTWRRVNGAHVAVCVLEGTAEVVIGADTHVLGRNDSIVLPAGVPNSIRTAPGSVLIPLGFRSGSAGGVGRPRGPVRGGADDRTELIAASVAAYSSLPRRVHGQSSGFDGVVERSEVTALTAEDAVVAQLASAAASYDRSLPEWAEWFDLSEQDLSGMLQRRAGMGFASWHRLSRMSRARSHLQWGMPVAAVARTLGYSHVPAFTRAFRAVHGSSPRLHADSAGAGSA